MTSQETLKQIMKQNNLTRKATAEIIEVNKKTIDKYLAPIGATSHREIPHYRIELLELKLKEKSA